MQKAPRIAAGLVCGLAILSISCESSTAPFLQQLAFIDVPVDECAFGGTVPGIVEAEQGAPARAAVIGERACLGAAHVGFEPAEKDQARLVCLAAGRKPAIGDPRPPLLGQELRRARRGLRGRRFGGTGFGRFGGDRLLFRRVLGASCRRSGRY